MLSVPFHSQYGDEVPESWRPHACTIANVKMVLDFFDAAHAPSIETLITEGESMSGFGPRGWTHDAIVFLLHNHGVRAYREEFRSRDARSAERFARDGMVKIRQSIESGVPVIVSLEKENGSYHTVLVVGYENGAVTYQDPETGPKQRIAENDFLKHWKRLAIFTY